MADAPVLVSVEILGGGKQPVRFVLYRELVEEAQLAGRVKDIDRSKLTSIFLGKSNTGRRPWEHLSPITFDRARGISWLTWLTKIVVPNSGVLDSKPHLSLGEIVAMHVNLLNAHA